MRVKPAKDATTWLRSSAARLVARRGLLFPARANKLYELYQRHASLEEIEPKLQQQIQEKYFGRSFEDVWAGAAVDPARNELTEADTSPALHVVHAPLARET